MLVISPYGRQEKKDMTRMDLILATGGGFFMAKRGSKFNRNSEEIKQKAVLE